MDSAFVTTKKAEDTERLFISRQCIGQCRNTIRTGEHHGVAGQSMMSGRIRRPIE